MDENLRVDQKKVKEIAKALGADLCGIAPVDRFEGAPKGFHPKDLYPECRSVIVYAKRMPAGLFDSPSPIPYTQASAIVNNGVDKLGIDLALRLEDLGFTAVPVPCDDPIDYWEEERQYARAALSMRHAGYLSGIGVIGKNTLLKNEKFGNTIKIGAVLVNAEIDPDPVLTYANCPPKCRKCIDSCPAKALDGVTVDQGRCRANSGRTSARGDHLMTCNACRRLCPEGRGFKRK